MLRCNQSLPTLRRPADNGLIFGANHIRGTEILAGAKRAEACQSVSVERLKHDPLWDPLRKDVRFDALIKRYEADREHDHDRAR